MPGRAGYDVSGGVDGGLIVLVILSALVFIYFNFRLKNKAKCFDGDVGSVGIAFVLLFIIGCLAMKLDWEPFDFLESYKV